MKHHRFYTAINVGAISPVQIPSPELLNQLKNVLRFKVGDEITIFDGKGFDYQARIANYSEQSVSLEVLGKTENIVRPEHETYLFASLVKKANFEWQVEKATELGVSHIIPIISARSEKKAINSERLLKIAIEAAEQSGRATIPKISEVMNLEDAISKYQDIQSIVWEPGAPKFENDVLTKVVGAYIGPEGGWTPKELDIFKEHGITARSLGPQILRAETAVVAVLSRYVF